MAARLVENPFQACRVAVGDQDLPEGVVRDQPDQLFDPPGVELVEQVVQQQDRAFALRLGDDGVLRQFEGDQEGFLLSLRPVFAQGITSDFQHQVVAVNACRREFVDDVLLPRIEQYLLERTVVQLRFVVQFDLLPVAREDAVIGRGTGCSRSANSCRRAWMALPCSHSCMS